MKYAGSCAVGLIISTVLLLGCDGVGSPTPRAKSLTSEVDVSAPGQAMVATKVRHREDLCTLPHLSEEDATTFRSFSLPKKGALQVTVDAPKGRIVTVETQSDEISEEGYSSFLVGPLGGVSLLHEKCPLAGGPVAPSS